MKTNNYKNTMKILLHLRILWNAPFPVGSVFFCRKKRRRGSAAFGHCAGVRSGTAFGTEVFRFVFEIGNCFVGYDGQFPVVRSNSCVMRSTAFLCFATMKCSFSTVREGQGPYQPPRSGQGGISVCLRTGGFRGGQSDLSSDLSA